MCEHQMLTYVSAYKINSCVFKIFYTKGCSVLNSISRYCDMHIIKKIEKYIYFKISLITAFLRHRIN